MKLLFLNVLLSVFITLSLVGIGFYYFVSPQIQSGGLSTVTNIGVPYALPEEALSNIPDVVERVSPAVVSVIITAEVPVIEQYFEEFDPFGDFFQRGFGFNVPQRRQVGTEKRQVGGGSGFFVSSDGYIVTNRHVVSSEGAEYSIMTDQGEEYPVEVIAKDPSLDIAILKATEGENFPFLEFGTDESVRLGSGVIAIGNALAEFPNSISVGVISGLSRNIVAGDIYGGNTEELENVIQTDAAINRGNSGGPLLNLRGEVIGVNVATAGGGENIGFALPADSVQSVYESVREHGEIIRPFLGVRYLQITDGIARENNLEHNYGILIIRGDERGQLAVMPGSAADKAGLEENDIILEFDGIQLDGEQSFSGIIRSHKVGETVRLRVLHDGEEKEVEVTLEKAPSN